MDNFLYICVILCVALDILQFYIYYTNDKIKKN